MRLTGSLDPLLFELPQAWLEVVTIICSAALILKTIIHFGAAYFEVCADPKGKGITNRIPSGLQSMCNGSHLLTNATVAVVVFGTTFMQPRFDPGEEMNKMSTSTANTMLLGSQYFTLHIIEHFRKLGNEGVNNTNDSDAILHGALDLTKMVPMLCLLFQSAGMHALEQDPPAGQPQFKIRIAMDVASYALFSAITIQFLCWSCRCCGGMVLSVVRNMLLLVVFGAAFCVCGSVWADPRLHNRKKSKGLFPDDPFDPFDMTVFASDMVLAVVLIATLFLGAHLVSWMAELLGPTPRTRRISAAVFSSLDICPIVAVLIVVLRLRSLQLSAGLGEPEAAVEICMYLVFIGMLGRLFSGTIGAAVTRAEDGDPEDEPEQTSGGRSENGACLNGVILPLQGACTLLVYVSVFIMLTGCIFMEKDNMQVLERPFGQFQHQRS